MTIFNADAKPFVMKPRTDSYVESVELPWYCCIDVECVASGYEPKDRVVARVAMVDAQENVLLDTLVNPCCDIVSYLTPITGINPGCLDSAPNLQEVVAKICTMLPRNAVLVGQGIKHDIEWLGLEEGKHFWYSVDIADLFRTVTPNGRTIGFSLRHEILYLTGFKGAGTDIQSGVHDACTDAIYSMRLYLAYCNSPQDNLLRARAKLLRSPRTPPTWKLHPVIDGVSLVPVYRIPNQSTAGDSEEK